MIEFENGALTTDATLGVADSQAIFQFADYCVQMEKERIIKLLGKRKTEVGHSLDKIGAEAREYWQIKCRLLEIENAIALIKGEKK